MQKSAGHSQSVAALTVPLFIFGLCIAAAASLWLRNSINSNAQTEFQSSSARITAQISLRLSQSINGLKSASGLYAATQGVNRSQFRSFIESRDLTRDFPGVR